MSNNEIFRECGKGWEGLLAPIIAEADRIGATLSQVKEKFARLRVYFDPGQADTGTLEDLIDAAEFESGKVCEICGKPGILMHNTRGSWLKTLCSDDALQLGFKKRAQT